MLEMAKADRLDSYRIGGMMLFVASASILAALGFQHIGGYDPCALCLTERYAYYAAIPALFLAMSVTAERPGLATLLFVLVSLGFLANAGLGIYHAGAEWKFWPGPATCSGGAAALPTSAAEMLNGMNNRVIRCDEAAWRMFGLSFAGWNAVISAALALGGFKAAYAARRGG